MINYEREHKISLVFVCRSYDLENDSGIKSLFEEDNEYKWEKIVVDYRVRQKSGSKKRYAYEFMSEGLNMLKSGKPQIYVYEEFGMKCGIKEYMKFSSLIVQNIKKGTKELALLLTLEAKDAFEERKNMAKKYGEEAGTKLLLPMIIMLIVVMAIIMVPALMSFSGY